MIKWFKINDRNFTAIDISLQYTIHGATIYTTGVTSFDIVLTIQAKIGSPDYNYIMDIYDNSLSSMRVSDYKFEIISDKFKLFGCMITSINHEPVKDTLTLDIMCDYVEEKDIIKRRDEIIDYILDKTNQ